MISDNEKGNKYHDELGRFSSGPSEGQDESQTPDEAPVKQLPAWARRRTSGEEKSLPSWAHKRTEGVKFNGGGSLRAILEEEDKPEFKSIDLEGIDIEFQDEIKTHLNKLMEKYPVDGLRIKTNSQEWAFGQCETGARITADYKSELVIEIGYSRILLANKEKARSEARFEYWANGSRLQRSDDVQLGTIYHEYGHAIMSDLASRQDPSLLEWRSTPADDTREGSRLFHALLSQKKSLEKEIQNEVLARLNYNEAKIEASYGKYATTNSAEFIAEAFSNMMLLKEEDKTPMMKIFEEVFTEKYSQIVGGKR